MRIVAVAAVRVVSRPSATGRLAASLAIKTRRSGGTSARQSRSLGPRRSGERLSAHGLAREPRLVGNRSHVPGDQSRNPGRIRGCRDIQVEHGVPRSVGELRRVHRRQGHVRRAVVSTARGRSRGCGRGRRRDVYFLALLVPSTRRFGAAFGIFFHSLVSLSPAIAVSDFSAALFALFVLFPPQEQFELGQSVITRFASESLLFAPFRRHPGLRPIAFLDYFASGQWVGRRCGSRWCSGCCSWSTPT